MKVMVIIMMMVMMIIVTFLINLFPYSLARGRDSNSCMPYFILSGVPRVANKNCDCFFSSGMDLIKGAFVTNRQHRAAVAQTLERQEGGAPNRVSGATDPKLFRGKFFEAAGHPSDTGSMTAPEKADSSTLPEVEITKCSGVK